ncbi:RDD family protein [Streptomyces ficellus]|uniref:RDD family protein n=1 Tax=Streptomyces ficellus TaxID=1977088 RepID=A0ABT7Z2I1_9ACTN|nr:RDD family protein [Streptomyces ficellus]MDN3293683.1 RDD family protein [Streptomyces ficellus]
MSAPTPATGDGSPTPGYYPDPSIPGYIRFWNGAAWVPGTSRPAPKDGEAAPVPPASAAPAPAAAPASAPTPTPSVEETGPVFFDEFDQFEEGEDPAAEARQEPASVWQADASRQTGFGGERDHRVSWGAESGEDPRRQATDPTGGALPGVRNVEPQTGEAPAREGTVTIRAVTPKPERPADGTMTIRALTPDAPSTPQAPSPPQPHPQSPPRSTAAAPAPAPAPVAPAPAPAAPAPAPAPATPITPAAHGPGGGAASWAQQVHQLAQPEVPAQAQGLPEQPVLPWKPPVDDPFLRAARAQAAARPAALGRRLAARLIDTVVLGAAVGAVAVPFVAKALDHIDGKIQQAKQSGETVTVWLVDGTTSTYFGIALAALLVLGVLYEALPTAKWGRTLGKKLCGLQVRDIESHSPPPFGAALRRWLVYGVLGVLVVGVVNVLWCLFDRPWRQCWHDKVAHTFVAGQ